MEAWSLKLLAAVLAASTPQFDMQSEDACVLAAKELTLRLQAEAICVNTFDGRVLWFKSGRQVGE